MNTQNIKVSINTDTNTNHNKTTNQNTTQTTNSNIIIDKSKLQLIYDKKEINPIIRQKYPFIKNEILLYDIQQQTYASKEIAKTQRGIDDAYELADYRKFNRNFIHDKEIFYSTGLDMLNEFPQLKGISSLAYESFNERYQIPIRLPNRDIFCFLGYNPDESLGKYAYPIDLQYIDWITPLNMLGNLESLEEYNGKEIYVLEGMFDAYRINEVKHKKSIATLGLRGWQNKKFMLQKLRNKGHKLISIIDTDISGKKSWLNDTKFFDKVININKEDPVIVDGQKLIFKDYDAKEAYKRTLNIYTQ